jgi:hypothetical protein
MIRTIRLPAVLSAVALLSALTAGTASAQTVVVTPAPTVTYYYAPPVVSYSAPTVTYYYTRPAVTTYYAAPVVTYAAPAYATTTTYYRGGLFHPRREVTVTRYYGPVYP